MAEFVFGAGCLAPAGSLPVIKLNDKEELLPIDKANIIEIDLLIERPIEESRLLITWVKDDCDRAIAEAVCSLKDHRLRKELKLKTEMAGKIKNFIVESTRFKSSSGKNKPSLGIFGKLTDEDTPFNLKGLFKDLKTWAEFLKLFREQYFFYPHKGNAEITPEGYYVFVAKSYLFKTFEDEKIDFKDFYNDTEREMKIMNARFNFDPRKQPPNINEECVWWDLPDKRIRIVLPHSLADERVVKYYGYEGQHELYLKEWKEAKQREEEELARHRYNVKESEKEDIKQIKSHLDSLFS